MDPDGVGFFFAAEAIPGGHIGGLHLPEHRHHGGGPLAQRGNSFAFQGFRAKIWLARGNAPQKKKEEDLLVTSQISPGKPRNDARKKNSLALMVTQVLHCHGADCQKTWWQGFCSIGVVD